VERIKRDVALEPAGNAREVNALAPKQKDILALGIALFVVSKNAQDLKLTRR